MYLGFPWKNKTGFKKKKKKPTFSGKNVCVAPEFKIVYTMYKIVYKIVCAVYKNSTGYLLPTDVLMNISFNSHSTHKFQRKLELS